VDAVLLSYPDLYHLGALPYACSKYGLKVNNYEAFWLLINVLLGSDLRHNSCIQNGPNVYV